MSLFGLVHSYYFINCVVCSTLFYLYICMYVSILILWEWEWDFLHYIPSRPAHGMCTLPTDLVAKPHTHTTFPSSSLTSDCEEESISLIQKKQTSPNNVNVFFSHPFKTTSFCCFQCHGHVRNNPLQNSIQPWCQEASNSIYTWSGWEMIGLVWYVETLM